jgi:hypothetical protein
MTPTPLVAPPQAAARPPQAPVAPAAAPPIAAPAPRAVAAPAPAPTPMAKPSVPPAQAKAEESFLSADASVTEEEVPTTQPSSPWPYFAGALAFMGLIGGLLYMAGQPRGEKVAAPEAVTAQPTPTPAMDAGTPPAAVAAAPLDAGEGEAPDAGELAAVPAPADGGPLATAVPDASVAQDAGVAMLAALTGGPSTPVADAGVSDAGVASPVAAATDGGAAAPSYASEYDRLLAEARASYAKERWGKAASLFEQALKQRPDAPEARAGLGVALVLSERDFKQAIPLLREAVKVDATDALAWLALGIALQNLQRDLEAKQPYREYLKLQPNGRHAADVRSALSAIP